MKMIKNQLFFWQALSGWVLVGGLVSVSPMINAQEVSATRSGTYIEEIVVTARNREESLQDVPLSISAYTAADIEAKSITNLRDLAQFVPNMNMISNSNDAGSFSTVSIRGISSVARLGGPSVGIYVDGVYVGDSNGINLDLLEIERVEVLRGPQGTLFGRNTVGGAISLVSKRPGDKFEGSAEVTIGRYDRIDAKVNVNVPLVPDKLDARLALGTRNRDGFGSILDFTTGETLDDTGDVDRYFGRIVLDWKATDNLSFLLSADAMEADEKTAVRSLGAFSPTFNPPGAPPFVLIPTPLGVASMILPLQGFPPITVGPDIYSSFGAGDNFNDLNSINVSLTADLDLGDTFLGTNTTIKSITSYRELETDYGLDIDFGPSPITLVNNGTDFEQISQEFQLSSTSLNDKLVWIAGLYYYTEEEFRYGRSDVFTSIFMSPVTENLDWNDRESWSVFGQVTFSLTEKLSITAGLRYTEDELIAEEQTVLFPSNVPLGPRTSLKSNNSEATGRIGLEYAWNDDLMTYFSAAKGYKTGGVVNAVNDPSIQNSIPTAYLPEIVWTYELGLKSTWLDNRLRFNLTGFFTDYTDIQYLFIFLNNANRPTPFISNGPEAETKGLEPEAFYSPLENLTLSLGYGFADSEYLQGDPNGGPLTTDSKFTNAPRNSFAIAADYLIPTKLGELSARIDYAWKDKIYFDIQDTTSPFLQQEDYGILNARMSLALSSGLTLSVFGTNLTDKEYLTSANSAPPLGILSLRNAGIDRQWGISASYEF